MGWSDPCGLLATSVLAKNRVAPAHSGVFPASNPIHNFCVARSFARIRGAGIGDCDSDTCPSRTRHHAGKQERKEER